MAVTLACYHGSSSGRACKRLLGTKPRHAGKGTRTEHVLEENAKQ